MADEDEQPGMRDVFALHIIGGLVASGQYQRDLEDDLYIRAWNIANGMMRTRGVPPVADSKCVSFVKMVARMQYPTGENAEEELVGLTRLIDEAMALTATETRVRGE